MILSLAQSTVAIILAAIAFRDSRPLTTPTWEVEEPEDRNFEKEIQETAKRLLEAEKERAKTPETWEDHERLFRRLI